MVAATRSGTLSCSLTSPISKRLPTIPRTKSEFGYSLLTVSPDGPHATWIPTRSPSSCIGSQTLASQTKKLCSSPPGPDSVKLTALVLLTRQPALAAAKERSLVSISDITVSRKRLPGVDSASIFSAAPVPRLDGRTVGLRLPRSTEVEAGDLGIVRSEVAGARPIPELCVRHTNGMKARAGDSTRTAADDEAEPVARSSIIAAWTLLHRHSQRRHGQRRRVSGSSWVRLPCGRTVALSRMYFPLRGNSHSLLAGRPAQAVRRRLVVAALLHDEVIVDEGMWDGMSGPQGRVEMRLPLHQMPEGVDRFQTAAQRHSARGAEFHFAVRPDDANGGFHDLVRSQTTIHWQATFEPFKRELPHAFPWLVFTAADLRPEDKTLVSRMVDGDLGDGILAESFGDEEFSRRLVIANADFSLVLGSRLGAATSLDGMHRRVIEARVRRGEAAPVYGEHALTVVFPDVTEMSWEEVDEMRRAPGLPDLRVLLAEIEESAWSTAESGSEIDEAVRQEFLRRFYEAVQRLLPDIHGTGRVVALGAGLGLVTGGLALPVGLAAGATQTVIAAAQGRWRYDHSWLAAAERLTRLSGQVPIPR